MIGDDAATPDLRGHRAPGLLDKERTIAPATYNRWLVPPAALAIHLSIGMAYGFSVFWLPLARAIGVDRPVTCSDAGFFELLFSTTCDWPVSMLGWTYTLFFVFLGSSAAVFGHWLERAGPRKAGVVAALCWSGGFLISAAGVYLHQVWLMWLGCGVIGGIGLGLGYISPVSTLIKWFPDRPGLATGLAIMGFGGGALIAGPASRQLLSFYDSGYDPDVSTSVASGGALVALFLTLGIGYFLIMMVGVVNIRVPAEGWRPEGWDPAAVEAKPLVTTASVSAANAIGTRAFWLLWIVLFCNVTAGIGILEQASPMIQDFFRDAGGSSAVAVAAAAGFVGVLSLFNMAGRFAWSSTSDLIGRKPIYMIYLGVGMVLYTLLASVGHTATALFVLLAGVILSFYGGGFATVPAYLRDLFGTYQVGAIHGRLLTAWSAAGVAGPLIINGFLDTQGKPGTLTADAYRPALFTMVGVLAIGFVANLLIRPVPERYHEEEAPPEPTAEAHTEPATKEATT